MLNNTFTTKMFPDSRYQWALKHCRPLLHRAIFVRFFDACQVGSCRANTSTGKLNSWVSSLAFSNKKLKVCDLWEFGISVSEPTACHSPTEPIRLFVFFFLVWCFTLPLPTHCLHSCNPWTSMSQPLPFPVTLAICIGIQVPAYVSGQHKMPHIMHQ